MAVDVAIIGAGFSGLGMAIALQKKNIPFTIYEAADEVGGTWRDNTYPGCACDVPSHLYSYSFELNASWSRRFSEQPEILAYLRRCAEKYGILPHIRFGTPISGARFDELSGRWHITTAQGEKVEAQVLINASGPLSQPHIPDIPGLDGFKGDVFHSSRWDPRHDLRDRTVAVVGTGASAIQIVPRIAETVKQLYLFQRTPPWVVPKPDGPFSDEQQRAFERRPWLMRLYRSALYWSMEVRALAFVSYPALLRAGQGIAKRHIREGLRDPALIETVTPRYTMGCKRILISNDYYPTLARDNVELVPHAVREVRANTLVAQDGSERSVDTIILATGFDPAGYVARFPIVGLGERELSEVWRGGIEAYYGIAITNFPNLFLLAGPNTVLGHNSLIFMIEAQIGYVMQCIDRLEREKLKYLDVRPKVQRDFNADLRTRLGRTVWQSGCQSWYLDANGHNYTLWPGYTFQYWLETRRMNRSAFLGV